ncbi:hypothetical protein N9Z41_02590, partial [bacterium]|nr:hypothetical protein [bacterium]
YSIFDNEVDNTDKLFKINCYSCGESLVGLSYNEVMSKIPYYRHLYIINRNLHRGIQQETDLDENGEPKEPIYNEDGQVTYNPVFRIDIDFSHCFEGLYLG